MFYTYLLNNRGPVHAFFLEPPISEKYAILCSLCGQKQMLTVKQKRWHLQRKNIDKNYVMENKITLLFSLFKNTHESPAYGWEALRLQSQLGQIGKYLPR